MIISEPGYEATYVVNVQRTTLKKLGVAWGPG